MNWKIVFFVMTACLSTGISMAQENTLWTLQGTVLDSETGGPVPMASVRFPDTNMVTLTDESGHFLATALTGDVRIVIIRTGYVPLEETVTAGDQTGERQYFFLEQQVYRMDTVRVEGHTDTSLLQRIQRETSVLKGDELERSISISLAETMKDQTGVAMRSMGPAPARPVLRGLSGDRVLIGQNGIGTADLSATSPDHAVTVEPFTVDRIEIIRGPATLLYSPVAIGGMIDTRKESIPHRLPTAMTGTLGTSVESARSGGLGAMTLAAPAGDWALYGEITGKRTGNEHTPDGTLDNTSLGNHTYVLGASRIFSHGHVGLSIDEFDSSYGIPGGFIGGHPNGVDIDMLRRSVRFSAAWTPNGAHLDEIAVDLDRTYYTHTEYESGGHIGAEFLQKNYTAHSMLTCNTFSGHRNTSIALDCRYRDLEMGGYVFTPPTRSFAMSAAVYHEWDFGGGEVHLGGRYDHARYDPRSAVGAATGSTARDRQFNTIAGSAALVYPFGPHVTGGITLSQSARIPTIEELYNEGPHLAAYSYETGNPSLDAEYGTGIEVFGHWQYDRFTAILTGYVNDMDSYIVFRNTGEINWQQILPIYRAAAVDARIAGFEGETSIPLSASWTIDINAQYTYGINLTDNLPLPMIPPLRVIIDTNWQRDSLMAGIETECTGRQDRIDRFERGTAGYTIVRPYIQKTCFSANIIHRFTLSVDNLFDATYRNHLSRIKSIMPETGRNVRITYRMFF